MNDGKLNQPPGTIDASDDQPDRPEAEVITDPEIVQGDSINFSTDLPIEITQTFFTSTFAPCDSQANCGDPRSFLVPNVPSIIPVRWTSDSQTADFGEAGRYKISFEIRGTAILANQTQPSQIAAKCTQYVRYALGIIIGSAVDQQNVTRTQAADSDPCGALDTRRHLHPLWLFALFAMIYLVWRSRRKYFS